MSLVDHVGNAWRVTHPDTLTRNSDSDSAGWEPHKLETLRLALSGSADVRVGRRYQKRRRSIRVRGWSSTLAGLTTVSVTR